MWISTPGGLGALFAAGFAIRLVLAGGGGFPFDMSSFAGWANRLAERGPWNFYPEAGEQFFVDYPPGYLYILWALGKLTRALGGGAPSVFWLKLPPILADLGLALLVGELARRLAPAGVSKRFDIRGPAAAAILLNPAVFFVSAVWGQVDVFLAVLVVGGVLLLGTGETTFRREAAGIALLAVAVGTKPQGAFALPMVVLFLCWRHIRSRLAEADGGSSVGREVIGGVGRIAALAGVGAVAGQLLLAPFRLGPLDAFDFYARASSTYSVTSVFAFNGWGITGFWRPDSGAEAFRVLGVPAFVWGLALFSLGAALVLARAWQSLRAGEDEGRVLVLGSAAITMVGFAVLTRVHERYLFLPMALLAVFVGVRWLRRAFLALSALYLINVFFPYVYYLKFVGRPAPTLGGFVDVFYGTGTSGVQLKILSAVTTFACLFIAARGWRALEAGAAVEPDTPEADLVAAEPVVPAPRPPWTLQLHAVGGRGALVVLAAFGIALLTRLPGLGHPPGMYFDEVYHARTAAEYLAEKEVFEWTHPPLAKELIAVSVDKLSGFGARGGGELPKGVSPKAVSSAAEGFFWVERTGSSSRVHSGRLDRSCALRRTLRGPPVAVTPQVIATDVGPVFIAGTSADDNVIVRVDARGERWRAVLPAAADDVVALGDRAFVLTTDDRLVYVSPTGEARELASGVGALASEPGADARRGETKTDERVAEALPSAPTRDGIVWASFPQDDKVVAWDADGGRGLEISVPGTPMALTAPARTERLVVSTGNDLTVLDSKKGEIAHRVAGRADQLASVPETEIAWAASGRQLRAIEPRSGAVIGEARLVRPAAALLPDAVSHRLVAVTGAGLECASGRPQFAWRLGSAIAGSAMVALVALLALRLFGNLWLAGIAALFLTVEGLAFTMSRIAIPESYTTAFMLGAWFCALSALYEWGSGAATRSRAAAIGWLVATGLFAGAAGSSKWVAVYGFAAIVLLFLWDGIVRARDGVFGIAGGVVPSIVLLGFCLGVIPAVVYVATYIPYFELGHSFGDLVSLQRQMFGYHANLDATHPFAAPWYGWPLGYRAVFLYLSGSGAERSEIWTIPNIVVFWGGLVGLAYAAREAVTRRTAALGVVVLAAAMQYLPWVAVGRVLFLYHYLPVVPFLAIGLAWMLVYRLRDNRYRRPITIAVAVASVAFFVAVLPMLEGWEMPVGYLDGVRRWLSWVIP